MLELEAIIDYNKPQGAIKFTSPAHVSSNYTIPASAENKLGTSFLSPDNMQENPDIDDTIGQTEQGNREYLYEPVIVQTTDSSGTQLVKEISADTVSYTHLGSETDRTVGGYRCRRPLLLPGSEGGYLLRSGTGASGRI